MVLFPDFQLPESLTEAGIEATIGENQSIPASQSGRGVTSKSLDWNAVTPAELARRIEFGLRLATEASRVTLKYFRTDSFRVERKNDRSPVTLADKQAEETVRKLVESHYPDDAILGEEFGGIAGTTPFEWIIDPIDGTKSFISGVPLYSTLVGLTYRGRPVLGVISIPALGELVLGVQGLGAWYGMTTHENRDRPILNRTHVNQVDSLADGLFLTSQVDNFDRRGAQSAYRNLETMAYVSRSWGDGYGYLLVATGRAELMVDPIVNPWDVAAVAPVITEAGGRFTSWSGVEDIRAGHCLASNGKVHDIAIRELKPFANHPVAD
ncbi:MAG: histidinol-phosphatase [Pirellula sp.]